jgi:hypothetical protein
MLHVEHSTVSYAPHALNNVENLTLKYVETIVFYEHEPVKSWLGIWLSWQGSAWFPQSLQADAMIVTQIRL